MDKDYPLSRTSYYRRMRRAKALGCDVSELPDGRGKHKHHVRSSDHYRWNSGKLLKSDGYVLVRIGVTHPWADPNGYIMEHILVLCSAIGRRLVSGEVIHHKNGDLTDNRLENLELMTNSEHSTMHREMERDSDGNRELDGVLWEQRP